MRLDDGIAFGVQGHCTDRSPVARGARPALRIACTSLEIYLVAGGEDRGVFTRMTLCGADVADAAVPVIMVIPMHEARSPGASLLEVGEALVRELRPVLRRAEQAFDIGVVIAHARARVRRLDA